MLSTETLSLCLQHTCSKCHNEPQVTRQTAILVTRGPLCPLLHPG